MKHIFVNGYGWTGSSAVVEAMKAEINIGNVPNEFDDLRVPWGVYDLYQQRLAALDGDQPASFSALAQFDQENGMPIRRQLDFRHILLLLARAFRVSFRRDNHINAAYRRYFFKLFCNTVRERRVGAEFKNNISMANTHEMANSIFLKWLDNIAFIYKKRGCDVCLFDQALLLEIADKVLSVSPQSKFILVIRSPSGQFSDILSNEVQFLRGFSWRTRFLFGVDDGDLHRIMKVFSSVTSGRLQLAYSLFKKYGPTRVLIVDYDNFLYNYNSEILRIANFSGCGLNKYQHPYHMFDLQRSVVRNNYLNSRVGCDDFVVPEHYEIYNMLKGLQLD